MDQFRRTLIKALRLKMWHLQQEYCTGCREDCANQLGHSCLFETFEDMLLNYYSEAFARIDASLLMDYLSTSLRSELDLTIDEQNNDMDEDCIGNELLAPCDSNGVADMEDSETILSRFYKPPQNRLWFFDTKEEEEDERQEKEQEEENVKEDDDDDVIIIEDDNDCSNDTVIIVD